MVVLVPLAALFALAGSQRAWAQTGGTSGTAAQPLAASDLPIVFERYNPSSKQWVLMNDTEKAYFFNRARCECNQDTTDYTGYVKIIIQPPATTSAKIQASLTANGYTQGIGRIYVGTSTYNCLTPSSTFSPPNFCTNVLNPTAGTTAYNEGFPLTVFVSKRFYETPPIPVSLFFGAVSQPTCGATSTCNNVSVCHPDHIISPVVYVWAQTSGSGSPDFQEPAVGGTLNIVGTTVTVPKDVTIQPGNDALNVSWSWPDGQGPANDTNFLGVQLFCRRGADYPVFNTPQKTWYGNSYKTGKTLCGYAPDTNPYGAFSSLDPIFLCSGLLSSGSSGYRIEGLQNGIVYGVGVAVVDKYYNVSPIDEASIAYGVPEPSVDFYTVYRDSGGSSQGGFCAIAGRGARSGLTGLACIAGIIAIAGRRVRSKRRGSKIGPLAMLVGVGLAGSAASAQPVYHDSSLVEESKNEAWGGTPRQFAFEARFGLYSPDVDSEITGARKPYGTVFGKSRRPMWQVEFDWDILQTFGTLSLGGVVGYFKENAKACTVAGLQANVNTCEPSKADNTSLRLIPFAALLVYRLDEAATRWKIPLVPYGKIGLNYTIWTVNDGNGDVPNYSGGGRGQGGTMGWQAAIGLSLQLDFLDPAAARGFDADAGVNHTYAFFELDHINGSGLYRKDVLRVGDNTWFAGLMFEF